MNDTPFIDSVPGDVLIFLCLVAGSLARLTRNESIGAMPALKEFYWSLVVGAAITGGVIWWADWHLKTAWWLALGAPMGCSMVIEIITKKGGELRDMPLKEMVIFLFDELQKRFAKTSVKP